MTNKKQTELDYDKLFLAYEECRADATAHFIKILVLQKKNEKLQERVKELSEELTDRSIALSNLRDDWLEAMGKIKTLEKQNKILVEALKKAEKRFSHIENWHRDNITDEYFSDCQDIGMTPEAYLRDGKNEAREVLKAVGVEE